MYWTTFPHPTPCTNTLILGEPPAVELADPYSMEVELYEQCPLPHRRAGRGLRRAPRAGPVLQPLDAPGVRPAAARVRVVDVRRDRLRGRVMKFFLVERTGDVYGALVRVKLDTLSYDLAFRIDGRPGKFRVDVRKPLFPAWEAIDGGEGFDTLAKAKKFAKRWLKAAKEQQTLTPRMEEP